MNSSASFNQVREPMGKGQLVKNGPPKCKTGLYFRPIKGTVVVVAVVVVVVVVVVE